LLSAGLLLIAIGLFLIGFLVDNGSGYGAILIGLCVSGVGIGLVNPPLASVAVSVVPPQQSGMASGISSTFRQVGIATGIAGLGAIFQHVINNDVTSKLSGTFDASTTSSIAEGITNGQVGAAIQAHPDKAQLITGVVHDSFVGGFNDISYVAAAIALAGAVVVALTVKNSELHGHGAPQPAATPASEG
jgi:hypothetical protein